MMMSRQEALRVQDAQRRPATLNRIKPIQTSFQNATEHFEAQHHEQEQAEIEQHAVKSVDLVFAKARITAENWRSALLVKWYVLQATWWAIAVQRSTGSANRRTQRDQGCAGLCRGALYDITVASKRDSDVAR